MTRLLNGKNRITRSASPAITRPLIRAAPISPRLAFQTASSLNTGLAMNQDSSSTMSAIPSSLKKKTYTSSAIPRNTTSRYNQVPSANATSARRLASEKLSVQGSSRPSRLRRSQTLARALERSCRLGRSSRSLKMK
ncbi:hypothetical protein Y695_03467 [Hydrogenophaga sp. T4]|nr:hypothetical protein Y695_03467 [Hydrogenophaga sp. T4]